MIKAFVTVWEGDDQTPPRRLGEYEFQSLPRKDDRLLVTAVGPWQDILLVLNVTHYPLRADTPAIGRFDPTTEVFVKHIGEEGED